MHLGLHSGLWAMAIVALIVGLFLILRSRRNKKWNWTAAGVLALIVAVGTFVQGWSVWPDHGHFIALVMNGQHDEAKAIVTDPNQWTLSDDGSLKILGDDSSKVTLSRDDLPLVALTPIPVRSWSEAIAGKQGFQLTSVRRKDLTVDCTAERGKVRIRHVESSSDAIHHSGIWFNYSWNSEAEKSLPGVDEGSASLYLWNSKDVAVALFADQTIKALKDNKRLQLHVGCTTKDGKTGIVSINSKEYRLEDGMLFLMSTSGSRIPNVKQVKRDIMDGIQTLDSDTMKKLAHSDEAIRAFFENAAKPADEP